METDKIIFSEESPESSHNGIINLIDSAWAEIGHGSLKDKKPNPNFDTYYKLASAGVLHVITARLNGEIVGYTTLLITDLMQHSGVKACFVDSMFLKKEHRKGLTGYRLLKFVENCARTKGAKRLEWGVTIYNDFSPILKRMGYSLESYRYGGDL